MNPPISHVPFIVPDRGSPSVTSSTFVKLKHLLVGAFSAKSAQTDSQSPA